MPTLKEMILRANLDGYADDNAEAKVCQDVVLKAISESSLNKNITIKGGVVMRSISNDARSATLLINSKEQMFTEKLKSLLKFGPNSTRYKDIFDMYYLSDKIDNKKLSRYLDTLIIFNPGMKENDMNAVVRRITRTFSSKRYIDKLNDSKKNWIGEEIPAVTEKLIMYLKSLNHI
ncbi:MAG: nucleotidyl transferase AbiEii/AbiGii toxin family protein [Lachnospiraceae bacterium]|nr:nucleotidyl transferase AbiEii/AbiGii toxin family protein [Lachnospiraceae bacterium]